MFRRPKMEQASELERCEYGLSDLKERYDNLCNAYDEVTKPTVLAKAEQEIAAYSYENNILNLGSCAVSIKRQQLLDVEKFPKSVVIKYTRLFVTEDSKTYAVATEQFKYQESIDAAYNRIVELLINAPADEPVNPTV